MPKSSHKRKARKATVPARGAKPHSEPEAYVPIYLGLYDKPPVLGEAVKNEAAEILQCAGEDKAELFEIEDKAELFEMLDKVSEAYWWAWHDSRRPKKHWHASQIRPVLKAAKRLQGAMAALPASTRGALKTRIERRSRSRGSDFEGLLDQSLSTMIAACEDFGGKGDPGRPKKTAITAAVAKLMDVWFVYTGKVLPISLLRTKVRKPDRDVGHLESDDETEEVFWRLPAQFVFKVMQGIDSRVTSSEVVTAIRRSATLRRGKCKKRRQHGGVLFTKK